MEFPLEAAPIGGQLFVLESGKSASIAFLLLLATYATRLLAQALSFVCVDLLINEHIDICRRTVHVGHPLRQGLLFIRVRGR